MNESLLNRCRLLIDNRDAAKAAFSWNSGMVHLCCASLFTQQGLKLNSAALKETRKLLRSQTGVFSYFRGVGEDIHAAILNASGDPQQLLDKAQDVYTLLKQDFMSSSYLPMAALILAERAKPSQYAAIASRTRTIYQRIRKEHPFLTSSEDSAMCALLAMSDMSDDELISRMEACYTQLKPHFFSGNAVQSLTHVLALMPGSTDELCARTLQLFDLFKTKGHRWGTYFELCVLGLLAGSGLELKGLAEQVVEVDDWLKGKPGFGFFSSVSRAQRLMYAGLMVRQDATGSAAAITVTLSTIIAQEVTMIAIMAAAVSAANASN